MVVSTRMSSRTSPIRRRNSPIHPVGRVMFRAGPKGGGAGGRRAHPVAISPSSMTPWSRIAAKTSCERASAACGSPRRRQPRRRHQQAGKQRRLRQGDVARGFVEVAPRGSLDAIGARAVIDAVEIHLQDLLLGEFGSSQKAMRTSWTLRSMVREGSRKRFLASCWVMVEPPWTSLAVDHILVHGARQADRVHPEMGKEAPILDGDDGLGDVRRHLVQAHGLAAGHAAIGDQFTVDGDDLHVGRAIGNRPVWWPAGHARPVK